MYYDAMIAKLCTYAKTREEAINFMKKSLSSFVIKGISHNISFLEAIIHNQRFIDGDINTGFIEQEYPDGFSGANLTSEINEVFVSTAIFAFLTEQKRAASLPNQMSDQSAKIGTRWVISIDDTQYQVMIKQIEGGYNIRLGSSRITISSNWNIGSPLITANINGAKFNIQIERISTGYNLTCSGISVAAYVRSPRMSELESLMLTRDEDDDQNELPAPLSGQIVNICVSVGDLVVPGQELVVLTAMKMENIITAQKEAKVAKILVAPQQNVSGGQVLIEFE